MRWPLECFALLTAVIVGLVSVRGQTPEPASQASQASAARPTQPAAPSPQSIERAAQILTATRQALGGEQHLASVKTFVATGRTRQIRGNNLVPIEFEISCELPDKFVRIDEIPAQDTDPSTTGFSGESLILFPQGPARGGRVGGPAAPAAAGRLAAVKQDFARLTLGAFAASFPSYPLTFGYAGEGQAPEGKADVIDVAGPMNFAARLVIEQSSHLPVMLMWQQPVQGKPVEYRLYYGDFRDVNGVMKWPFRLRRAVAGDTIEETTFDRIRLNVKIDPKKFEVPK
jgi:hypothetical protein